MNHNQFEITPDDLVVWGKTIYNTTSQKVISKDLKALTKLKTKV